MFEVGFFEVVDVVPLRADAFLACACFAAPFDVRSLSDGGSLRGALRCPLRRNRLPRGFHGWRCDGSTLAGAADTSSAGAAGPAGTAFVRGPRGRRPLGSWPCRRSPCAIRLVWPRGVWLSGGVGGPAATEAGAGRVVLDPKAAWTVANASSSESWRVSTVTFIRCSSAGESRDVRSQCPTRGRHCGLDSSAAGTKPSASRSAEHG